ncbi:MAG: orotidine-5'-phosphate decarboxylase [Candidatus Dormibacteria bacterium]
MIESTAEYACAFKPNIAFFECHGSRGYAVLERLRGAVGKPHLWLVDAKRGDIGSTASAYATALFDVLGADAVTVNPLMGEDAVRPFLERAGRGAFLLTRTSNPGAADILDRRLDSGVPIYQHLAELGRRWDTGDAHGLVVGATDVGAITALRQADGDVPLLIPGVGAQGGSLEQAVAAGLDRRGGGLLLNIGRGIASSPGGPAAAARLLHERVNNSLAASVQRARRQ